MSRIVRLRTVAQHDVEAAVRHLRDEAGTSTAAALVDAFEHAIGALRDHPGLGSPRFSTELELPGLRAWPLQRFRYVIFYLFDDEEIDVWRVLHTRRDLPRSFHPEAAD